MHCTTSAGIRDRMDNRERNRQLSEMVSGQHGLISSGPEDAPIATRDCAEKPSVLAFGNAFGSIQAKMCFRAASQIATTAGCLSLRSTEMA
jgi:hypothetical protein